MNTLSAFVLCTASILIGGRAAADAVQQQQVNMMLAMMEQMGELQRLAQCVDLPQTKLKTILAQSLSQCGFGDPEADEPDAAHVACMQQSLTRLSGVSPARWQACDHDEPQQGTDPLLAELEALSDHIGEREPTAAEQQQMENIIARMQQHGVAQLQQMVDGMIAGSQGSEASITLPIFPQASLLINLPAGTEVDIAEQSYASLPGASFLTTASPEQVLTYYRQQLPDYVLHRPSLMAATDVALMQSVPAGFDYSRDIGQAFSIAHIYIQPASETEKRKLAEAKTLFFIYYKPAQ